MGCMTVLIGEVGGAGGGGSAASAAAAKAAQQNGPKAIKPYNPIDPAEPRTENHYVECSVVDAAGLPLQGLRYKLTDPDGKKVVGAVAAGGRIRHDGYSQAGSFKVEMACLANVKWSKAKCKPNEKLTLKADAEGFEPNTPCAVMIFEAMGNGNQRLLKSLDAKVSGNKVSVDWTLTTEELAKVHPDTPKAKVEYFFILVVEGIVGVSDTMQCLDTATLEVLDPDEKALAEAKYELHLRDGSVRSGKTDKQGKAEEKDVTAGPYTIVLPDIVIHGKVPKQGEVEAVPQETSDEPPWMSIARAELGEKEIAGKKNNPRIVEYHHAVSSKISDDETPWCSSFVNWVMKEAGYEGTKSAVALSWKKYGRKLSKPALGAIAVIDWSFKGGKNVGKGHVGFVAGKQGKNIVLLGGNQSDQVKLSAFKASLIVTYVMPKDFEGENETLPELDKNLKPESFAGTR